jgi:hypothetical protein
MQDINQNPIIQRLFSADDRVTSRLAQEVSKYFTIEKLLTNQQNYEQV